MHKGGGRWVGSNKLVELKKKKKSWHLEKEKLGKLSRIKILKRPNQILFVCLFVFLNSSKDILKKVGGI